MIDTIIIAVGGKGKRISKDLQKRGLNTSKVFLKIKNKPLLSHLINMAIKNKFRRIFLLSSYYESSLRHYLKKTYPNEDRIIPIYGGQKGRKWGVPWLLCSIKHNLSEPFIYSDGNILYKFSILQKIKSKQELQPSLINIVLSSKDQASTHSRINKYRGKIYDINERLTLPESKQKKLRLKQYYSLGLMVLSPQIFSLIPNFAHKKDLDCVVSELFKSNKKLVEGIIYQGDWLAIHTIQDVDNISLKE